MARIPLSLPPGVWRNGTQYESKGRYFNSNLMRWYSGQLRPWGGWQAFSGTAIAAPPVRGMINWIDNSGLFWLLMGTPTKVYISDFAGEISDITPAGLTAGRADATNAAGYGSGAYGSGNYGVSSGTSAVTQPATVWTMDTLEQTPVICNADDGKIYTWDLTPAHVMTQASGSPTACRACFVTPEGFLVAIGAGGDPRALQWADQDSTSAWTPTASNQARSYELMSAGQGMCGVATRGGSLVFTTTDVHLMTYLGLPYVYSVVPVGTQCGIVSQLAHADAEDFVAWMGINSFWKYDGAVAAVESDVSDYVFSNINPAQRSKVWATHNAGFGEITWFYPSFSSIEIDSYVTWNYREGHWAIGSLVRTSGVQPGVLTNPVMVDASGTIWNHEVGFTYTGASSPFAETGPIEFDQGYMGDTLSGAHPGTFNFDIVEMLPDALTLGDFTTTFYTRFYPLGPETTWGPYSQTNPTDFRISGRQFRLRFTGAGGGDFRIGEPRLDFRPAGSR